MPTVTHSQIEKLLFTVQEAWTINAGNHILDEMVSTTTRNFWFSGLGVMIMAALQASWFMEGVSGFGVAPLMAS